MAEPGPRAVRLRLLTLLCALLALPRLSLANASALRPPPPRPNFLIIMADDLGIGDLGCYGNDTIRTPNIDRLAQDGVRLTHHLAAESVCTPSRAAFLTGRYPVRTGMTSGRGNRVLQWAAGAGGLPPQEVTFARVLQGRGYVTGLVGKWHLGLSCHAHDDLCHHPHTHGFHHFLGLPLGMMADCAGAAPSEKAGRLRRGLRQAGRALAALAVAVAGGRGLLGWGRGRWVLWAVLTGLVLAAAVLEAGSWAVGAAIMRLDCFLMRNASVTQQPLRLGGVDALLLREAEAFLGRHSHTPFLLLVSLLHVHTPVLTAPAFRGRSNHGRYGDSVEEMDWVVGRLLAALDREGLADRTLVHFTSDNGGWVEARAGHERLGGWNGVHRGGKGTGGLEGGIRVPGIFRFPGVLPRGRVLATPTSLMDVFPTVVALAGGALPKDREIDGRDLLPLLRGETPHSPHDVLLHYCEVFLHAARWVQRDTGQVWKAHFMTPTFDPPGSGGCGGHDGGEGEGGPDAAVCPCVDGVEEHDPPLLYELTSDPEEARPLPPEAWTAGAWTALARVRQEHGRLAWWPSRTPQQLGSLYTVWRPWLQPCCGQACSCDLEGGGDGGGDWGPDFL